MRTGRVCPAAAFDHAVLIDTDRAMSASILRDVARPLVRFERWAANSGRSKRTPAAISVDFLLT
jgi:hypothetical protein